MTDKPRASDRAFRDVMGGSAGGLLVVTFSGGNTPIQSALAAMMLIAALTVLYYFHDRVAVDDERDSEPQNDPPDWEPVQRNPRQAS